MPYKGWDAFFFDPGEVDSQKCRVCGEECEVKRDCYGHTSSISAMADGGKGDKFKRKHDSFYCPNTDEAWHLQCLDLVRKIQDTPSGAIISLLKAELTEIIESGEPTLDKYYDRAKACRRTPE